MSTDQSAKLPAMTNRLFAKRCSIIAARAADWASHVLEEDVGAWVPLHVAERFASEIHRNLTIIVRDARDNER